MMEYGRNTRNFRKRKALDLPECKCIYEEKKVEASVEEEPVKKSEIPQQIPPFIDYPYIRTKMLENIIRICLKNNKEDE